ncbi:MAG TPA: potassium channel family protein [Candidatus Rikenella faecigallinarum]|uniref:Potassium channel family protein n=1 Tax=Candidatus Rikenella faecigallinarum TaxID=2838745 RepID=A0A9D1QE33_9BACT|nr:potassium channel family protein [Candidatus Rikenella faecigallinarum]
MNTAQPLKPLYTRIIDALNVLVLLGALAIVASLSYDILTIGRYRPESPLMLDIQLVVCTIFILDFLVRWIISPHKGRFVARNFMLLLFSIPYLNILHYSQIEVSHQVHYLLGFVPLLRGGYGLVMITRWFTRRSATSLMVSYLSILVAVTYFISLIFFVVERGVNPGVKDYWDALWWACMDMTTVGCDIVAVTPIGKIISFILAAAGIMMLPIFTVYITDRIAHSRNGNDKNATSESASDAGAKTSE